MRAGSAPAYKGLQPLTYGDAASEQMWCDLSHKEMQPAQNGMQGRTPRGGEHQKGAKQHDVSEGQRRSIDALHGAKRTYTK